MALKTQKEAERAEQQRIKNLVLNYDLVDSSADHGGIDNSLYLDPFSHPNPNLSRMLRSKHFTHSALCQGLEGDKQMPPHHPHNAPLQQQQPITNGTNIKASERTGGGRRGQHARKLQLSDVDWYDKFPAP